MPLLTVRAAAERLGVGYSTLKQWIYHGTVRTTRTSGGHHRIALAEVDRLLAAQTGVPPEPAARTAEHHGVLVALSGRNQLRGLVDEIRGDGLLVQSITGVGSGVNIVSGDVSVGAEGLLVRDGEAGEPVREATIATTIPRMLRYIVAVGADLEWTPGGSGAPSLAVADISLSGS